MLLSISGILTTETVKSLSYQNGFHMDNLNILSFGMISTFQKSFFLFLCVFVLMGVFSLFCCLFVDRCCLLLLLFIFTYFSYLLYVCFSFLSFVCVFCSYCVLIADMLCLCFLLSFNLWFCLKECFHLHKSVLAFLWMSKYFQK